MPLAGIVWDLCLVESGLWKLVGKEAFFADENTWASEKAFFVLSAKTADVGNMWILLQV
jgi:hypothetical protein